MKGWLERCLDDDAEKRSKKPLCVTFKCVCVKVISTRGENFNELGLA